MQLRIANCGLGKKPKSELHWADLEFTLVLRRCIFNVRNESIDPIRQVKAGKELEQGETMNFIQRALRVTLLMAGMGVFLMGAAFAQSRIPDVHYEPTPQPIVEDLLKMADVNRNDVVYDLGCGD